MTISRLPDPVSDTPLKLTERERKVITCTESTDDAMSCQRTLYLGFFFDGTRNNRKYDTPEKKHGNIARLFDVFEEQRKKDEGRQYRFRTYAAGVGTEFWKEVGDAGVGLHAAAGAAAGWGGEARINWALLQLQNNLHRYAKGERLTREDEDRELVRQMSADISLSHMQNAFPSDKNPPSPKSAADVKLRLGLTKEEKFGAIANSHWFVPDVDARRRVLARRRAELLDKLKPVLTGKFPRLARICISVFGFSRGAAEARVFVNWLRDLCDNATGPMRICGVPATVDFLGLFDTVASVGAAQGLGDGLFDGHGGWAQPIDLRIPGPQIVTRCLHLVSGHEVRGSFPLDMASGANVEEVVYPGVHSDVGGGYLPGEQGRGCDDAGAPADSAKLSQIPLCHMYRAALAAGVPLMNLATAPAPLRAAFQVDPALAARFNGYLSALRDGLSLEGESTRDLVHRHYRAYLGWRRARLGKHNELPSVKRAGTQDRVDLLLADSELDKEWSLLKAGDTVVSVANSPYLSGYTGLFIRAVAHQADIQMSVLGKVLGTILSGGGTLRLKDTRTRYEDPGGPIAGYDPRLPKLWRSINLRDAVALILMSKWKNWQEISTAWNEGSVPAAISALMECDVHDSRAWFKPMGLDDDEWLDASRRRLRAAEERDHARGAAAGLTPAERRELENYRRATSGGTPRGQAIPESALPPQAEGREPYEMWGYLRWRTCYADPLADYRARYPQLAIASRDQLLQRKRELQRQFRQCQEQIEQATPKSSPIPAGGIFGSGGGMPPADVQLQLQGLYARKAEIAAELVAVHVFLQESGPLSWWESVKDALTPG